METTPQTVVMQYLEIQDSIKLLKAAKEGKLQNPIQSPVTIGDKPIDIKSLSPRGLITVMKSYLTEVQSHKMAVEVFGVEDELNFSGYSSGQIHDGLMFQKNLLEASTLLPQYEDVAKSLFAAMTTEERKQIAQAEAQTKLQNLRTFTPKPIGKLV